MKLLRVAQRCATHGLCHHQLNRIQIVKNLSTHSISGNSNDNQNKSAESLDDFESRMFGNQPSDNSSYLYQKLDGIGSRVGGGKYFDHRDSDMPNILGDGEGSSTLTDGLDGRLKEAATYFEVNENETMQDDYTFRPDMNVKSGMTYTPEDLNLRKPGVWKPSKRSEFEVTTKEVLRKADFRNVRFLANFLTEGGIIIKRSKTGISAKAQRKVAREIKTARAFGLLPFTTMGTKSFVFGKTMEDLDKDFELDNYDTRVDADDIQDNIRG